MMSRISRVLQSLAFATMVAVCLSACPLPGKSPPHPNKPIPFDLKYPDRDQSVKWMDGDRRLFLGSVNFKFPNTDTWLYFTEGKTVGDAFEATNLLVGRLGESSWMKDGDWLTEPCQGSVMIAKDGVRFDVSGSKDCETYHGHFRPVASEKASTVPDPACAKYTACVCALAKESAKVKGTGNNVFQKICADAEKMLATAKDAPATCRSGLSMIGGMGKELGLSPSACQ